MCWIPDLEVNMYQNNRWVEPETQYLRVSSGNDMHVHTPIYNLPKHKGAYAYTNTQEQNPYEHTHTHAQTHSHTES